jgi:hypothetical protein
MVPLAQRCLDLGKASADVKDVLAQVFHLQEGGVGAPGGALFRCASITSPMTSPQGTVRRVVFLASAFTGGLGWELTGHSPAFRGEGSRA